MKQFWCESLERRVQLSLTLLQDLGTSPRGVPEPTGLVDLNGKLLFAFEDLRLGRELFVSDGTADGTHLLVDINRVNGQSSSPANLAAAGNYVYFSANDGIVGAELWRTDGTASGTARVADLNPTGDSSPYGFTALPSGEVLFFSGTNLYRTDGTAGGTVLLKDLAFDRPALLSSEPVVFNNQLYFLRAKSGTEGGGELWRSDGTAQGTVRLESFLGIYPMESLKVVGNRLFFTSDYKYIYCSDGSIGGTTLIDSLGNGGTVTSGVRFGHVTNATSAGGFYYFTFGRWLCKADATDTYLVRDFTNPATGTADLGPMNLIGFNGKVFFSAIYSTQAAHPRILWSTDGTEANTLPMLTTPVANAPTRMTVTGGRLWFLAEATEKSIFVSDGTVGGTSRILSLTNGTQFDDALPRSFTASGDSLFFAASDYSIGWTLWRASLTNPIASSTLPIEDLHPGTIGAGAVFAGTVNNKTIYFASTNAGYGVRYTDGTTAGSGFLRNVFTSPAYLASQLVPGVNLGGYYYFASREPYFNPVTNKLWRTDGTPAGTVQVGSTFSGTITSIVLLNNRILITRSSGSPYVTDGTTSSSLSTSKALSSAPIIHNGIAYGPGKDSSGGVELWRSDGTDAGTYRLADIRPGDRDSNPQGFVRMGDDLLFFAAPSTDGNLLYKLNIATEALSIVKDVQIDTPDYYDGTVGVGTSNGRLFFASQSTAIGSELYVSDGTREGTTLLKDINPGSASSFPSLFIPYGKGVLFRAMSGNRSTLWYSDGTEAGTRLVASVAPKSYSYINGELHFIDNTPEAKVWRTDGTTAGTKAVVSLPTSSMFATENYVLVSAFEGLVGDEVWTYQPDAVPLAVQSASFTPGNLGGQFRFSINRPAIPYYSSGQPLLTTAAGTPVTPAVYHYSVDSTTGEFVIDLIRTTGTLPEGNYRITLPAGLFTDADLNTLAEPFTFDLHQMNGDATGDGNVNFDDLLIVAQHYGQSGRTFRQGDFDYSGTVDFDDLLILAQRYGTTVLSASPASTTTKRRTGGRDVLA